MLYATEENLNTLGLPQLAVEEIPHRTYPLKILKFLKELNLEEGRKP